MPFRPSVCCVRRWRVQSCCLRPNRRSPWWNWPRVDSELRLVAEIDRLTGELQQERERQRNAQPNAALNRRLQAESEEVARLRKLLEEARAKLDAITKIEQSFSDGRPPPKDVTSDQPSSRKARILLVDDDPGLLRLLTIRLRAENYDVEAWKALHRRWHRPPRFRPDLVISDLRMEPVTGSDC